jgi:hypothetical protein
VGRVGLWPEKKGKPLWVRLIWILMPPLIFLGLIGVLWLLLG